LIKAAAETARGADAAIVFVGTTLAIEAEVETARVWRYQAARKN